MHNFSCRVVDNPTNLLNPGIMCFTHPEISNLFSILNTSVAYSNFVEIFDTLGEMVCRGKQSDTSVSPKPTEKSTASSISMTSLGRLKSSLLEKELTSWLDTPKPIDLARKNSRKRSGKEGPTNLGTNSRIIDLLLSEINPPNSILKSKILFRSELNLKPIFRRDSVHPDFVFIYFLLAWSSSERSNLCLFCLKKNPNLLQIPLFYNCWMHWQLRDPHSYILNISFYFDIWLLLIVLSCFSLLWEFLQTWRATKNNNRDKWKYIRWQSLCMILILPGSIFCI